MEKSRRLAEKPQCINSRLYNPNCLAVENRKFNLVINKPFQLRFAVLEYSKLHICRIYDTLKDWYGYKMRMLYTDPDSLIMQFFMNELYNKFLDVHQLRCLFDFDEISATHPSCLKTPYNPNRGKVNYFKEETNFVVLKFKMYSFKVLKSQEFS